jgi:rSAM/selenodomain-associated transferase 2
MQLSIIIPTLNEESNICQLLSQLLHIKDERIIEIIVADGGSTDKTCNLAKKYPIRILDLGTKSRAFQMNEAAKVATGDVLYFIHADTRPPISFVDDIYASIKEGYQIGSYSFKLDSTDFKLRVLSMMTKINMLISRGGDQTLFVARSLFDTLDGYDEEYVIMEDFDFIRRARKKTKFRLLNKSVLVSARKYEKNSYLTVQRANLSAFLMFYFGASPKKIKDMYNRTLSL